jgi:hypothetical protein
LIRNDFLMQGESRKIFFPEFPGAAGNGSGDETRPSLVALAPLPPRAPAIAASFLLAAARERQEQRGLAPGQRADEV